MFSKHVTNDILFMDDNNSLTIAYIGICIDVSTRIRLLKHTKICNSDFFPNIISFRFQRENAYFLP